MRLPAKRKDWTEEEEEALKAGINKHGAGKWKNILKDPEFSHCLAARSNVDLADHYRCQFRIRAKVAKEKWTEKQEEALKAGVKKYGPGKWKDIRNDPEFGHCLAARSNIDLKVKWRMILWPKGKAAALEPALIAIPNAPASIFQSPPPDEKSALRYHSMIPNGADIGAINDLIEGEKKRDTEKERMGARRQRTAEEEEALKAGIKKHGAGKWKKIKKDPAFCHCVAARSNIELTVHYHSRKKETPSKKERIRAPNKKWTAAEEEALKAGANKYGTGKWKKIKTDPEFGQFLAARSNNDLKLKWSYMHWPEVKVAALAETPKVLKTTEISKRTWTATEDRILSVYIKTHGEGGWSNLPTKAGLKRSGRACRDRWFSYLRPNIKRGNISSEEEELIIKLHKLLGNSWSFIAGRLQGRTNREIRDYWNTTLAKKIEDHSTSSSTRKGSKEKKMKVTRTPVKTRTLSQIVENRDKIRGSTDHCRKMDLESGNGFLGCPLRGRNLSQNSEMDCTHGENCCLSEFSQLWSFSAEKADDFLSPSSDGSSLFLDEMLQNWTGDDFPSDIDIESLVNVLGSEEDWLEE